MIFPPVLVPSPEAAGQRRPGDAIHTPGRSHFIAERQPR